MRIASTLLLTLVALVGQVAPARAVKTAELTKIAGGLERLVTLWQDVRETHLYLNDLQPVAVVVGDSLAVFLPDSTGSVYVYDVTAPVPFPMASGIRAAFPLEATGGRPACVVGRSVFESEEELVLLLHEFVHCAQANTVEYEIKATLTIATEAMEREDWMWELEHPFPYADPEFVARYGAMIAALGEGDGDRALAERAALLDHLSPIDREYLVWQEWKEGLARFAENRIRAQRDLPRNDFGGEPPLDRVAFYVGGSAFIGHLTDETPELHDDPRSLFEAMR